ncbi:MAG: HAD-IA family hydrolase [Oscillospiraceae bacterium]|nr:HAD-IA family hydrolase [Oscillospiraceae bacterium]
MGYNTVIFDMDGTILDTLEDLRASANYILCREGMAPITLEQTRRYVGNGARVLWEQILGPDHPDLDRLLADFKLWYAAHNQIRTGPYAGILELMEALRQRGITMAVVSNKPHESVLALSRQFFGDYMALSMGEQAGISRKPAPDMVWSVMEQLGRQKDECVYVGDSEVDFATAGNAGLDCVSVSWGFRDRELLEQLGPKAIIDSPMELLEHLD